MFWVEAVPNFSEGREKKIIEAVVKAICETPGVVFLHWDADPDHNRTVVTLLGPGLAVVEACFRAARVCAEKIDLRRHEGVHPRLGALDVVPFVPLWDCPVEEAVKYSCYLGERIGEELEIPVFLYGESAKDEVRKELPAFRRGGLEALSKKMREDPKWKPDFGPFEPHPKAGVCLVGVRDFLIAYNVLLKSQDLKAARGIAKRVRKREGVKSLAFPLASRGMVQVSMNLVNYRIDSPGEVFQEIQELSLQKGICVESSEIVGLVPLGALVKDTARWLKLESFSEEKVVEGAWLKQMFKRTPPSLLPYLSRLGAKTSVPGGGSAGAVVAAIGVSLLLMVLEEGREGKLQKGLWGKVWKLLDLAEKDEKVYSKVVEKGVGKEEKKKRVEEAGRVPLEVMSCLCSVLECLSSCFEKVSAAFLADLRSSLYFLEAAFQSAREMVLCNEQWLKKQGVESSLEKERQELEKKWSQLKEGVSL